VRGVAGCVGTIRRATPQAHAHHSLIAFRILTHPYNSASDDASILAETGVRLVPIRKANIAPNTPAKRAGLRTFRTTIETVNSQAEAMGAQRLRARTNAGFDLKVWASVLALICTNMN